MISIFCVFFRYGPVQSVKLLGKKGLDNDGSGLSDHKLGEAATIAFMDIKSANKALSVEHKFEDRVLRTDYYDPSTGTVNSSRLHPEDNGPGPGGGGGGPPGPNSSHGGSYGYRSSNRYANDGPGGGGTGPSGGYGARQRLVRTTGYRSQGGYAPDK